MDGDADRIIYYFADPEHGFRLLDGDKIATLAASFIGDLAREARLSEDLKIGVRVQSVLVDDQVEWD